MDVFNFLASLANTTFTTGVVSAFAISGAVHLLGMNHRLNGLLFGSFVICALIILSQAGLSAFMSFSVGFFLGGGVMSLYTYMSSVNRGEIVYDKLDSDGFPIDDIDINKHSLPALKRHGLTNKQISDLNRYIRFGELIN